MVLGCTKSQRRVGNQNANSQVMRGMFERLFLVSKWRRRVLTEPSDQNARCQCSRVYGLCCATAPEFEETKTGSAIHSA